MIELGGKIILNNYKDQGFPIFPGQVYIPK